jgi:hypothetical protein
MAVWLYRENVRWFWIKSLPASPECKIHNVR